MRLSTKGSVRTARTGVLLDGTHRGAGRREGPEDPPLLRCPLRCLKPLLHIDLLQPELDRPGDRALAAKHRLHEIARLETEGDAARETSRLRPRPEQRVRVERQPQRTPSKRARVSFGSGASKSAATRTLPRRAPSFLGPRRRWTGTSLAMGFPLRVITTSSPR